MDESILKALRNAESRKDYVVLDTETTGLNDGEICQIALVGCNGVTLLDTLVKPVRPIPSDATRIHRITNEMVAAAPGWADVAPKVLRIISGKDVFVYNAVYDRKMMHKSAEYAGMEKIDWKRHANFFCVMEAYAEYVGDWNNYHGNYRWHKLADAARAFDVTVKDAHSALGDCLMTLGVIKGLAVPSPVETDEIPF